MDPAAARGRAPCRRTARGVGVVDRRRRMRPDRQGGPGRRLKQHGGLAMNFEFLFKPFEELDSLITGLFDGAPLLLALVVAFLLGLRHASDPDHLVAVTSLVAADDGDTRRAARIGAWWGLGHGGTLLVVGLPLILFKSELPDWLESGAERAVGVVILLLAVRVLVKWTRGDYRAGAHATRVPAAGSHRHLRRGPGTQHTHVH